MSVWIAGATVAVGAGSMYMANKQGDKASDANAASIAQSDKSLAATTALEEEKLDFAYEQYDEQLAQYDEWKAIYGPIEENLGEFYNALTPETFAAAGLEYTQQEFQKQKTQTFQTLAQRGLDSSGITAAIDRKFAVDEAKADATTRRNAPFQVAEMKGQFLNQGKGGPNYGPTGTVGNVMANNQVPNALANSSNMYANQAAGYGASSASAWGSAGNMLSTGVNYFAKNYQPTANTGSVKTDYNPTQTPYMPAVYS